MNSRYRVDLSGLQASCEINYYRLQALLPPRQVGAVREFVVGHGHAWHCRLEMQETSRYTSLIRILQGTGDAPWLPGLEILVRAYHDVRMAEVVACQGHRLIRPLYDYPNPLMHQRNEKSGLNAFLGEWLAFCARRGHEIEPALPEPLDA